MEKERVEKVKRINPRASKTSSLTRKKPLVKTEKRKMERKNSQRRGTAKGEGISRAFGVLRRL